MSTIDYGISYELYEALQRLDPQRAKFLQDLVRDALALAEAPTPSSGTGSGWPVGYFEATAGALAGEEFERPPQGNLPDRDSSTA